MVSVLPVRTSRLTEVICVGQGGFANKVSLAGTCWALDRRTGSPRMEEGQLGGRLAFTSSTQEAEVSRSFCVFEASLGHTVRPCCRSLPWKLCGPKEL